MLKTPITWFLSLTLLCVGPLSSQPLPAPATGVTLAQCYEWAKARNEDLKIRQEDVAQADAKGRAALGSALPRVEWELNQTWQDPKGVDRLERRGFSGFVEKDQVESNFKATQPLFSGLREFSARSGFQHQSLRDALLLQRAQRELFARTAAAFYAVVSYETDRENTAASLALAQDRVKELHDFLRLGKSRHSEVYTAQAHAAALNASLKQTEGRIRSAREDLSLWTGHDLSAMLLQDQIPDTPVFGSLDQALAQAHMRVDLRAQREDVEAARLRIRYEKGLYWPSADLTGKYYTQRATFLKEIDWDVVLSLDVPLFQGGTVAASVREASSAYRQAVLRKEQLERQIVYTVRKTHGELMAAVEEVRSLEEAADAAQKSYDAQRKEYKLGLVTNLEVLEALDLLQAQKSARDTARFRAKQLFIELQVAMGTEK